MFFWLHDAFEQTVVMPHPMAHASSEKSNAEFMRIINTARMLILKGLIIFSFGDKGPEK